MERDSHVHFGEIWGEKWFSRCFLHRAYPSSPRVCLPHTADIAEPESSKILRIESILAGKMGSISASPDPQHPRIQDPRLSYPAPGGAGLAAAP